MRIRELTIENYRAFGERRTFTFSASFTAIAGINGRGKTSLLDGLALLGYRLPKKLPAEVPRGQAAAYSGALFNRTVNFRDFMARYPMHCRPSLEAFEISALSNRLCGC